MPRFSPRQIITTVSTIYLILLTSLAAYALHRIKVLSLPIPNVHSALTLALPALAGIALETLMSFRLRMQQQQQQQQQQQTKTQRSSSLSSSRILQSIPVLFLILETLLATLSGTHIAPVGGLWCPLHDRWQGLFQAKEGQKIRAIQDALGCCGLVSVRDMAWPFTSNGSKGGGEVCAVRYDRTRACLEPWRDEERRVAVLLLVVPVGVFLWKVALFLVLPISKSEADESDWLPSTIRLPNDHNSHGTSQNQNRPRQAITYHHRDVEQQRGLDEGEEDVESSSLRQEVNRLNRDSNLATRVESGRRGGPGLVERERENGWADE